MNSAYAVGSHMRELGIAKVADKLIALLLVFCLSSTFTTFAQDADAEEGEDENTEATVTEDEASDGAFVVPPEAEEVVVTGSRLKRSTFTSISPLQIIDAEVSREVGLINAEDILQESTQASGQQIDSTYVGFVLDNGPGAATVDLRGLDADRTLVLINGRRVAPAGVGGAPSSPDISLVPGILVQDYELLLDGASSVYGSDAIAGVSNIILRDDFDGIEVNFFGESNPEYSDAHQSFSVAYGKNFDRGYYGIAASMRSDPHITVDDSPFTAGCTTHAELDENGALRRDDRWYQDNLGMDLGGCRYQGVTNAVLRVPYFGWLYWDRTDPNTSVASFSDQQTFIGGRRLWYDGDGDGSNDVNLDDNSYNGKDGFQSLYGQRDFVNFMAYGEYTLDNSWNLAPFFEASYAKRESFSDGGDPQLFPTVPALNPYNPCNPAAEGGVDCGQAYVDFLASERVQSVIFDSFGCLATVNCLTFYGPVGPQAIQPIIRVAGDRSQNNVEVEQSRYVIGANMDLPFMNFGSLSSWTADVSLTHSSSIGIGKIHGIRGDRLNLALGALSATQTPCDLAPGQEVADDVVPGCVPVNLFAPSLWPADMRGQFATQAEADYLFDFREFDTRYKQTLFSAFANGNVGTVAAGPILGGVGIEVRRDWLDSIPNEVARDGLFFGYSSDEGAAGEKTTNELFGEIEFPLIGNEKFAEEVTINLSGRVTNDEYYGSDETHAAKVAWRPFTSLLFRATKGSSYRSPNLRNLFLRAQTGFLNVSDPCFVPSNAIDEESGAYLPDADRRLERVLENCRLNGVDPITIFNNGFNTYNIEIARGGSTELDPERSDSTSVGLVFEQPYTNEFDLSLGLSYYSISVDGTIIEPSHTYIVNDCYYSAVGTSTFCDRIIREPNPDGIPVIDLVRANSLNRDNEKVRGVDYNVRFTDSVTLFDQPFNIDVTYVGHRLLERSTLFTNDGGDVDANEFRSEWGYHRYKHSITSIVSTQKFRFIWRVRGLSPLQVDTRFINDYSVDDTCSGPPDDVLCKDVSTADRYYTHNFSLSYGRQTDALFLSFGITNAFNEEPPFVDPAEVFSIRNRPYGGYGYDLLGRSYVFSVGYSFGGG